MTKMEQKPHVGSWIYIPTTLNGRNVILALASSDFDETTTFNISTKEKMAHALNSTSDLSDLECGKPVAPRIYQDSNLEDFVNEESWLFFQLCQF